MNSNTKSSLIKLIKTLVKEEVKLTLKPILKEVLSPIIKESAENMVNKILAERFVKSVNSKNTLSEMVDSEEESPKPTSRKMKTVIKESRKEELLKRMGIENDGMMSMIYEDVEDSNIPSFGTVGSNGQYVDSDDEGLDISQFGF